MTSHSFRNEHANYITRNNADPLSTFKTTQLRAGDAVLLFCLDVNVNNVPISIWTPTGNIRTLHTLPSPSDPKSRQSSHPRKTPNRPIPQGEPPFYRQDIPGTCSVPASSRILYSLLDFLDGCLAHSRMTLFRMNN